MVSAKSWLLGTLFFLAAPIFARIDPSPGDFAFQGELLYWSASYDDTYFVINGSETDGAGSPTPSGKKINNPVGYNFGFRLEGIWAFCNSCVDMRLRWSHVHAKSRESVSNFDAANPQLWATENIPNQPNVPAPFAGKAISFISTMHQRAEILINQHLWNRWCLDFTLREGIEWSYIRYNEQVQYATTSGLAQSLTFHGHTKGLGPQIGIITAIDLCGLCCLLPENLSFTAMTTATLIAANSKAKLLSIDILSTQNKVNDTSFWRFLPEWVFRFGFNYSACLCCMQIACELGYEITSYVNGVAKMRFTEASQPGLSFDQYCNFTAHGLFLSLGIAF